MAKVNNLFICLGLVSTLGCSTGSDTIVVPDSSANKGSSVQDVPVVQAVDVAAATSTECANGGLVYTVYIDANNNGAKDSVDTVVSSNKVCNGKDGVAGSAGHSIVFTSLAASSAVCPAGGSTLLLAIDIFDQGVYDVSLPNQQAMTLCNGVNGQNGQNAQVPSYSMVEPIIACGNTVAYKEVLLRLQNGQVLGSISNDTSGSMTRLSFLPDGSFMNTDNSGCTFSLATSVDGLIRSISWGGQVQMSWAIIAVESNPNN